MYLANERLCRPVVMMLASVIALTAAGCAKFGYSDRVLHRVPSPDRHLVAVCQEVPVFDGPDKDIRIEQPDGTVVRKLYHLGDGDGCDELVWAPDGRTLAILSGHVARIFVLDVQWALGHPDVLERHWYSRQFDFSWEGTIKRGTQLKFLEPLELEFQLCPYSLLETQQSRGKIRRCTEPPQPQRLRIPSPLVTGQP